MTLADFALLNAHWTSLTNKSFQCEKIYELYKKRRDCELVTKIEQTKRGCGKFLDRVKVEIDNMGYKSCLCHQSFKHPLFSVYLSLSDKFEKGVMPFSGGMLDQPAQIIEVLSFISKLKQELEQEQQKEASKQSKGK